MVVKHFAIRELLPDTNHYMTYDGSTTMPACHETTTWIILNKPIYITKQQVSVFVKLLYIYFLETLSTMAMKYSLTLHVILK